MSDSRGIEPIPRLCKHRNVRVSWISRRRKIREKSGESLDSLAVKLVTPIETKKVNKTINKRFPMKRNR